MPVSQVNSWRVASASLLAGLLTVGVASAATLSEGFDGGVPAGWTVTNNSSPLGSNTWFQGNTTVFSSQSGASNSFVSANYSATTGAGTISDWLIAPTLTFNNGDVVSFWSRTVDVPAFADRLELRFSSVGGTNVGTLATDVGDFGKLLLSINPTLTTTGYPSTWTPYTATISGLAGPTSGAIAFRYFVTNGGPSGSNSDYVGVDTLTITPVPEPMNWLLMALGLGVVALRRSRRD